MAVKYFRIVLLVSLFIVDVFCQYQFPFVEVSSCTSSQVFNSANQQCEGCPTADSVPSANALSCECSPLHMQAAPTNGVDSFQCNACQADEVATSDGSACIPCSSNPSINSDNQCVCSGLNEVLVERGLDGSLLPAATCVACTASTEPSTQSGRCAYCSTCNVTACPCALCLNDDVCITYVTDEDITSIATIENPSSSFIDAKAPAAYAGCLPDNAPNVTACQALSNMCVMQLYSATQPACALYIDLYEPRAPREVPNWKNNLPWIYYNAPSSLIPISNVILTSTVITTSYSFRGQNSIFDFVVMKYDSNGTYLGWESATTGLLQICPDRPAIKSAAFVFGTAYQSSCTLSASDLGDLSTYPAHFYELNVRFTDATDASQLFPVPVLITNYEGGANAGSDTNSWVFVKRFFLVDSLSGDAGLGVIRYASEMSLWTTLQTPTGSGLIYPPYLRVTYSTADSAVPTAPAQVSFSTHYMMAMDSTYQAFLISLLVLGGLGVLYALFETGWWRRRQGLQFVEGSSLIMFVYFTMSMLANVFFVVMFGYSIVTLFFYKAQTTVTVLLPTTDQAYTFVLFTSLAFAFKCVEVLGMIVMQSIPDIFLVDWERPREASGRTSIWRTYFVANEWNEIQVCRKTNFTFQIFAVLLFLEVIGFKSLALENPDGSLGQEASPDNYIPTYSPLLRYAIAGLVWAIIGLVQVVYQVLIHERFIQDKIREFVDLCSVSNISVFILANKQFGYYIHGRSPHGRADTDMMDMNLMLKKEEEDLTGGRGLETGSDQQSFQCSMPVKFRAHFDRIYQPLELVRSQPAARGGNTPGESLMNESVRAYDTMRSFLTSFLDHSIRDLDYFVKDKVFLESLLDMEFQEPVESAYFYNDRGNAFTSLLFYGREFALITFDIMLFTIIDYHIFDYVTAAIVTYVIGKFLSYLRQSLGRQNLAKKTLVDERFLI